MPHTPHSTIPQCPACNTREKAVLDLDHNTWYCFNCHATGTATLTINTDPPHSALDATRGGS